ncbi:glucose/galactose MFS transporter [Mucilaginibacter limnophilus]|uniref:Glucose/galactose MFS transporter n=1 Tax=Mucilaginibacter limnophilus TaxID=1932778 RepID=A0A437MFU1_9SPHI|nr:sugar MFS transporter [Mucilaginibacter limnophilus]RVT96472.1 glucose/galactose MFS transporter [Mucilaginibacter limnophilus]
MAENNKKSAVNPIILIGILFFIFGFITWLNSVLIPYLKLACELNNLEAYLVAFSFYISYFVMAIPSSWILNKTGFKKGMSVGLIVIAVGALVFIPAALSRQYILFLLGLFIQGSGLALLQTASNPYITILGPPESAAKRISIMGISNKIAGAIAPIILGAVALKDADGLKAKLAGMDAATKIIQLNELASRVILPYIIIVIVLLILAAIIYYSRLPEIDTDKEDPATEGSTSGKTSVFQFPHLLLGAFTLFLYVGAEVIAGDTVINYGSAQGIALSSAKFFTTATLVCMIVGYLAGIICIPKYFSQETAMKICALLGLIFSVLALITTGFTSVLMISLLGLANSLIWPAIWPMALAGLGRFTKIGSSLLIMGIAGGAVIPLAYGALADAYNLQHAYIILIPIYLMIGYYAISGHKSGRTVKN